MLNAPQLSTTLRRGPDAWGNIKGPFLALFPFSIGGGDTSRKYPLICTICFFRRRESGPTKNSRIRAPIGFDATLEDIFCTFFSRFLLLNPCMRTYHKNTSARLSLTGGIVCLRQCAVAYVVVWSFGNRDLV